MSTKGNCWDNAVDEAFITLKTEQLYEINLYQRDR
jgi:hypothetical protein